MESRCLRRPGLPAALFTVPSTKLSRGWNLSVRSCSVEHMFDIGVNIPAGLAVMSPGVELACFLKAIDRSRLNGHELVIVMQARARQIAHEQAEFYADMIEISHCPPGDAGSPAERHAEVDEFASDEIRAALRWTRRAADSQLDLAWHLRNRLPQVWDALHAGQIDLPRARVIASGTSHLSEESARRVVAALMDRAGEMTTGQLAARIRTLCVEIDPEDAKNRYEEGLAERRIVAEPNPDGTANLIGCQLAPHRVTAVRRRIDRLAKSLKTADDSRTIDQIRADVFLDLLDGEAHGATSSQRGTVDIQVDLNTLVGLADNPGQIPGWGPVIADIARQAAAPSSRWRVTVTDPDTKHPLWNGTTRRRPSNDQQRHIESRHPTCVFPGCRMPAADCDLDHTLAWGEGGPTNIGTLAPLCRHDHRLKHQAHWQLEQASPGRFTWTSRLGHVYATTGRPP